jgi:hypothetical protein
MCVLRGRNYKALGTTYRLEIDGRYHKCLQKTLEIQPMGSSSKVIHHRELKFQNFHYPQRNLNLNPSPNQFVHFGRR